MTDRKSLTPDKDSVSVDLLMGKIDQIISAGVDWVQVREKDLSAKDLSRVVRHALRSAAQYPAGGKSTRILVNDRLDVALGEGARGVHLPENSVSLTQAKQLVRNVGPTPTTSGTVPAQKKDFLVGVSCHSRETAEAAAAAGADYILFGPVFATPSKAKFGPPQGLDRLAEVCRGVQIPVIAIGGVKLENVASCVTAGATGIAAIRLFQDVHDLGAVISALRRVTSQR